jgi:hypothetical protein
MCHGGASRRNKILSSQRYLERSGIVAHQPHCGENPSQRKERSKHPVLPSNSRHSPLVLGAVGEETSVAFERLATDEQPDLRRLLDIAHPLPVHVRGAEVELIVIQNEPNRDFVGLPGLASIVGQGRGRLARYPLESRKCVWFHKVSLHRRLMAALLFAISVATDERSCGLGCSPNQSGKRMLPGPS